MILPNDNQMYNQNVTPQNTNNIIQEQPQMISPNNNQVYNQSSVAPENANNMVQGPIAFDGSLSNDENVNNIF